MIIQQLLRRKAADEVKRQQEIKEKERMRIIAERTGKPKSLADANEGNFEQTLNSNHINR